MQNNGMARAYLDSYAAYLEQEERRLLERRSKCTHSRLITWCVDCRMIVKGDHRHKIARLLKVKIDGKSNPVIQ